MQIVGSSPLKTFEKKTTKIIAVQKSLLILPLFTSPEIAYVVGFLGGSEGTLSKKQQYLQKCKISTNKKNTMNWWQIVNLRKSFDSKSRWIGLTNKQYFNRTVHK